MQRYLLAVDRFSTWIGKAFSWCIAILTIIVCYDVFLRYVLSSPTLWAFDVSYMLYGTLFMMAGAYTLAQNGHVRGDFLYGSMRPRTQATLDLILYILFFIPGIAALAYSGIDFAATSWRLNEHSSLTSGGPPIYYFKTLIPIAGALVLFQGHVEIIRCILCLKTGAWPDRLNDVEETDVVEMQLKGSDLVSEEDKKLAIEKVKELEKGEPSQRKGEL
jgi:TRAP-type mannitol/chloroaromatic compound transport system permease small subunit